MKKTKGKTGRIFQELKQGDIVAVHIDKSDTHNLPKRMQGRTGVITGKRGKAYIIDIKDFNEDKKYIIKPIHLKKLKWK